MLLLETPSPVSTPVAGHPIVSPFDFWATIGAAILPLALPAVEALVVVVVTLVVGTRVRRLARRGVERAGSDVAVASLLGQLAYFTVLALGAIWVLAIFSVPPAGLFAAFGAAGLAFGLSLQDVLRNLIAGLYLLVERPFRLGDRLMVRGFEGTVESVDLRTTTLVSAGGERVIVPNAILFAEVLVNRGVPQAAPDLEPAEEGPIG